MPETITLLWLFAGLKLVSIRGTGSCGTSPFCRTYGELFLRSELQVQSKISLSYLKELVH